MINEQRSFTDGRVVFLAGRAKRGKPKRADYILRYRPDYALAIVEAKSYCKNAGDGVQQAKEYTQILGLKFAYVTNGREIIEIDFFTGKETERKDFPAPDELWRRQREALGLADDVAAERILAPARPDPGKPLRYYQELAVNRAVQAIVTGQKQALLTLCTGAGQVAFQICWKLGMLAGTGVAIFVSQKFSIWPTEVSWSMTRRQKTLYRSVMRVSRSEGKVSKSRDIYFAIYQAIAEAREGLFREFAPDFFDLVIVDECHRGSARDESSGTSLPIRHDGDPAA